jgi:predicted DCC family thiol-disulfide oxidoreductase YuxK
MLTSADVLQPGPILLYDGNCGVCSAAVQWILQHERRHELRFAPLEGALGRELRSRAGVPPSVDSLLWVELRGSRVHSELRSSSVLRVLRYVGGPWRLLTAFRIVPRFLRDAGYRAFARLRSRVREPSCLVPSLTQRARFIGA